MDLRHDSHPPPTSATYWYSCRQSARIAIRLGAGWGHLALCLPLMMWHPTAHLTHSYTASDCTARPYTFARPLRYGLSELLGYSLAGNGREESGLEHRRMPTESECTITNFIYVYVVRLLIVC